MSVTYLMRWVDSVTGLQFGFQTVSGTAPDSTTSATAVNNVLSSASPGSEVTGLYWQPPSSTPGTALSGTKHFAYSVYQITLANMATGAVIALFVMAQPGTMIGAGPDPLDVAIRTAINTYPQYEVVDAKMIADIADQSVGLLTLPKIYMLTAIEVVGGSPTNNTFQEFVANFNSSTGILSTFSPSFGFPSGYNPASAGKICAVDLVAN